jgi:hypothetical protein
LPAVFHSSLSCFLFLFQFVFPSLSPLFSASWILLLTHLSVVLMPLLVVASISLCYISLLYLSVPFISDISSLHLWNRSVASPTSFTCISHAFACIFHVFTRIFQF